MSVRDLPTLYLNIQVMDDSVKVLFSNCTRFFASLKLNTPLFWFCRSDDFELAPRVIGC
jgi:hypothetical protein